MIVGTRKNLLETYLVTVKVVGWFVHPSQTHLDLTFSSASVNYRDLYYLTDKIGGDLNTLRRIRKWSRQKWIGRCSYGELKTRPSFVWILLEAVCDLTRSSSFRVNSNEIQLAR